MELCLQPSAITCSDFNLLTGTKFSETANAFNKSEISLIPPALSQATSADLLWGDLYRYPSSYPFLQIIIPYNPKHYDAASKITEGIAALTKHYTNINFSGLAF